MARVFLINPPHPEGKGFTREGRCTQEAGVWATQWPPVSLATAAAFLEKDGHRLRVIDCPATACNKAALEGLLKEDQPDFVFWNTGTPTLAEDLNLAESIKKAAPDAITGVLGTHVTAMPDLALENPYIDLVIRHEPEQTIREICLDAGLRGKEIDGVSYRDNGKIRHNRDRAYIPPDDIPPPAWRHMDLRPYRLPLKGRPFLIIAPVRGCPFSCNFCTAPIYYGKRLRKRPVKNVVDEVEDSLSGFGVRDFFVWADTFTADREYVAQFCQEIETRGLDISWACNSRVDTVDKEILCRMKKAGLWMISFGLESGDNEILKMSGKGINVKQSRAAVSAAHALGIRVSGHFIFGLPGETGESMLKTLGLSLDLPLDIAQFYAAAPFPGTDLYEQARKNRWLQTDSSCSQGHAVMELPGLSAERINAFRRSAYRRFYLRPKVMLNMLSMLKFGSIKGVIRNLKEVFRWVFS